MIYIHQDKQTNVLTPYGSIKALSNSTGIKKDNLYTQFGRNGKKEFETDSYRIVKTEVIRSSKHYNTIK